MAGFPFAGQLCLDGLRIEAAPLRSVALTTRQDDIGWRLQENKLSEEGAVPVGEDRPDLARALVKQ